MEDMNAKRLRHIMANVSYYQALKGVNDLQTSKGLKVSRQMFSLYRKGDSFPTFERLLSLAEFLECDVSDLLKTEAPNSNAQIK